MLKKGKYQHYKGNFYEVIDTVIHSESEEILVLYRPLYGEGKLWVRPYDMFIEKLHVEDRELCRFSYIGEMV